MSVSRIKTLTVGVALLSASCVWAQDAAAVRLGFLLNFCRYVDWPQQVLSQGGALNVCLAPGDSEMAGPFGALGKQAVPGRTIQARTVSRPSDVTGCHVIYLPADVPGTTATWLVASQKASAMTVSDLPDFVEIGGMVGLASVGGRYRFDINLGAAHSADLRFSSQLLKLARSVR